MDVIADVAPVSVHSATMVVIQVLTVVASTAKLLVRPGWNDVEKRTVSVQIGSVRLHVHGKEEDKTEAVVGDDDPLEEEVFLSFSSSRSWAIFARTSVRFSISLTSGLSFSAEFATF